MILILSGHRNDPTIVKLVATLEHKGADVVTVDTATVETARISHPLTLEVFDPEHRRIGVDDITAAFLWRSSVPVSLDPRLDPIRHDRAALAFVLAQWNKLSRGYWHALEHSGVRCVSSATGVAMWEDKITQLMVADQVGLETPPTIYSCDLAAAAELADEHGGRVVYKPFTPYMGEPRAEGKITELYSQVVTADDLRRQISRCTVPTPGIFQPYVDKAFELRVVYVGGTIFTCRIESQKSEIANRDWRRYDLANTPHVAHDLDGDVQDRIRQLMGRMGLVFGSLDLIVTPAGDHIFLEVNPVGQFDWIAAEAGLPIYDRLAGLLLHGEATW